LLARLVEFGLGLVLLGRAPPRRVEQPVLFALFLVLFALFGFERLALLREIGLQLVVGGVGRLDFALDLGEVVLQILDLGRDRGFLDFHFPDVAFELVDGLLLAVDVDERLAALVLCVLDALLGGPDRVLQPTDLAFDLLDLALDRELFVLALPLDLGVAVVEVAFESGHSSLALVEFAPEFCDLLLAFVDRLAGVGERLAFFLQLGGLPVALVLFLLITEILVFERGLAFVLQLFEPLFFLLHPEFGLLDPALDHFEFLEGVLLFRVERRDPCDLVDDFAPLARGHVDDPRDVALHHDVVPLGGDAGLGEQVLDVREVHRPAVDVIIGVVVVLGLFDPALDGDLVDAPDVLGAGGALDLGPSEGSILVVENDCDARLARAADPVALVVGRVVDQVGELPCPDPPRAGESEREQDGVDDVRLARAVRAANGSKILIEGDPGLPAETLEVV